MIMFIQNFIYPFRFPVLRVSLGIWQIPERVPGLLLVTNTNIINTYIFITCIASTTDIRGNVDLVCVKGTECWGLSDMGQSCTFSSCHVRALLSG